MRTGGHLRAAYPELTLEAADLYLLEAFQIGALVQRVPPAALAAVLHADPVLARTFQRRFPPVAALVDQLRAHFPPITDAAVRHETTQAVLWEVADLVIANAWPDAYDARCDFGIDLTDITSAVDLAGAVVLDVGAGTGRLALRLAPLAKTVFAVEPVGRLRRFIARRAHEHGVTNVHEADGFLDALPFPDGFADVLVTCHAIAWDLPAELAEIDRVVRPGGTVIHLTGFPATPQTEPLHAQLGAPRHGYRHSVYTERDGPMRKYVKRLPAAVREP